MQAYATAERLASDDRLCILESRSPASHSQTRSSGDSSNALIDQLLGRLADLVAERLMERAEANRSDQTREWMDARGAAAYLGIHRDTVRKLAAQRAI